MWGRRGLQGAGVGAQGLRGVGVGAQGCSGKVGWVGGWGSGLIEVAEHARQIAPVRRQQLRVHDLVQAQASWVYGAHSAHTSGERRFCADAGQASMQSCAFSLAA